MKTLTYIFQILSILLSIYATAILIQCFSAQGKVTEFGSGFIIGNVILLSVGLFGIYFSNRQLKKLKK